MNINSVYSFNWLRVSMQPKIDNIVKKISKLYIKQIELFETISEICRTDTNVPNEVLDATHSKITTSEAGNATTNTPRIASVSCWI